MRGESIEAALRQMDEAPRQVLLNARIVVMERNDLLNLGLQWDWPTAVAGAFSNSDQHAPGQTAWPWDGQIGYSPGKEFTNSLALAVNLLTQNEEATVLSSPQVMAQDGGEAQIKVTTEEYFEIVTQGYYTNSDLQKIESGTILRITPRIGPGNEIDIRLSAEASDVVSRGEDNLPVVTRRTTDSDVAIHDGGTVAFSALMDNRTLARSTRPCPCWVACRFWGVSSATRPPRWAHARWPCS